MRSGEVRGLRWPDLDLPARRLTVRRALWRKIVKQPKSNRSRRIAITPELATALGELYEAEIVARGRDASGYVLVGRDGVSPISEDTPLEVAQQVQARAGLTVTKANSKGKLVVRPRVTYHELRHTAATQMLTRGISPVVVARQLGHGDSRITTMVDEHLQNDALLDAALDVFRDRNVAQNVAQQHESFRRIAETA